MKRPALKPLNPDAAPPCGGTETGPPTQAVAHHRHGGAEVGVPLPEERVQPVDLRGHGVHDGLAVGGAVVEQHVQQRLVGEVTEATRARQRDLLDSPGREKRGFMNQHTALLLEAEPSIFTPVKVVHL